MSRTSACGGVVPSVKDGLYAWLVVLACFVLRIFIYGMTTTSGILYVIFLDEFKTSKGATAIVGSLITASGFFIGTVSGVLVNRFGCRAVVIFAGLLASGGLCVSALATSVTYLVVSYGIVAGCGFGLCYVPCSVLVSQYFDKQRNLALGLAASGGGVGSFVFPILLRWLIGIYGWRGTLLISGGITLNMCVCGAIMRPFVEDENSAAALTKSQAELAHNLFHWDIFKNKRYMIFMVNHLLFSFGISVVYVHLASFGKTVRISEDQSASVFSAMGLFVVVSKIGTGVLASLPSVDEHAVYLPFLVLGGASAMLLPFYHDVIWFGAMACLFSLSYASLGGCIVPALCARYGGIARLSTSYGLSLLVDGIGHFIGAPIAGLLYDVTGVYANSFYLAGAAVLVSAVIMIPPWRCMADTRRLPLHTPELDEKRPEEEPLTDIIPRLAPLCLAESQLLDQVNEL